MKFTLVSVHQKELKSRDPISMDTFNIFVGKANNINGQPAYKHTHRETYGERENIPVGSDPL